MHGKNKPSDVTAAQVEELAEELEELCANDPEVDRITREAARKAVPEVIRTLYRTAATTGPQQEEAIAILRSRGLDPFAEIESLSDDEIRARVERHAADTVLQ